MLSLLADDPCTKTTLPFTLVPRPEYWRKASKVPSPALKYCVGGKSEKSTDLNGVLITAKETGVFGPPKHQRYYKQKKYHHEHQRHDEEKA
jgi:hypothetical protein